MFLRRASTVAVAGLPCGDIVPVIGSQASRRAGCGRPADLIGPAHLSGLVGPKCTSWRAWISDDTVLVEENQGAPEALRWHHRRDYYALHGKQVHVPARLTVGGLRLCSPGITRTLILDE